MDENSQKLDAVERERKNSRRVGFIVLGVLCILMPTLWVIATLRQHRADIEGGLAAAKREKEAEGVVEYQNEIVITPSTAARPTHHDVAFSIGAILAEAKACMEGFGGTAFVSWQVNPDGSATDVRFETRPGGIDMSRFLERTCLPTVVAKARVAPFDGAPVRVTYPFRNMPSAEQIRGVADMFSGKSTTDAGSSRIIVVPSEPADSPQKQGQTRDL